MASVQLSQRPILVLAGAIVLHVILISAQVNTAAGIPVIQVVTFGLFSEIQRGTMTSVDSVRGLWSGYVALRDAQTENEALKNELQRLQVRLQEERGQAQRAENFRKLLELRDRAGVDTVAAEVIAGPATLEFLDMVIDKGSTDGVARDMAVIAPSGVVGRVHLAGFRAARVQMLIDYSAAAGAMIERTRAQGLIVGLGSSLRMDYVASTADVKQGDLVVTSGIDQVYPKGFVIGTVESVERTSGTYLEIAVRPAVDFSRIEEVLVVTTPPPAITAEQIAKEAEAIANAAPPTPPREPAQNASPATAPPRREPAQNASPAAAPRRQPAQNASPQNASPPGATPRSEAAQNASPQGPGA